VVRPIVQELGRLKKEHHKLRAAWGCIVSCCLKKNINRERENKHKANRRKEIMIRKKIHEIKIGSQQTQRTLL
jgi:hypothetical protein